MLVSMLCACTPLPASCTPLPVPLWHLFHPGFPLGPSGLSQQHHWVFLLLNDREFWSVVICGFICAVEYAGWTSWVVLLHTWMSVYGRERSSCLMCVVWVRAGDLVFWYLQDFLQDVLVCGQLLR